MWFSPSGITSFLSHRSPMSEFAATRAGTLWVLCLWGLEQSLEHSKYLDIVLKSSTTNSPCIKKIKENEGPNVWVQQNLVNEMIRNDFTISYDVSSHEGKRCNRYSCSHVIVPDDEESIARCEAYEYLERVPSGRASPRCETAPPPTCRGRWAPS